MNLHLQIYKHTPSYTYIHNLYVNMQILSSHTYINLSMHKYLHSYTHTPTLIHSFRPIYIYIYIYIYIFTYTHYRGGGSVILIWVWPMAIFFNLYFLINSFLITHMQNFYFRLKGIILIFICCK